MAGFSGQRRSRRRNRRRNGALQLLIALGLIVGLLTMCRPADRAPDQVSRYAIAQQSPFNHPDNYPLQQVINRQRYQPIAPWLGRLVLPAKDEVAIPKPADRTQPQSQRKAIDWVWFEVYNAPLESQALMGKLVRLEWSKDAALKSPSCNAQCAFYASRDRKPESRKSTSLKTQWAIAGGSTSITCRRTTRG